MKEKLIVLTDAQINLLISLLNKELSLCDLSLDNCRSSCRHGIESTILSLNHPLFESYEGFDNVIHTLSDNNYASSNQSLSESGVEAK